VALSNPGQQSSAQIDLSDYHTSSAINPETSMLPYQSLYKVDHHFGVEVMTEHERSMQAVDEGESVWDYPRPPRIEHCTRHLVVKYDGLVIAATRSSWRVLETSHPPTFYIPPDTVRHELLVPSRRRTFCEFKGRANYWHIQKNKRISTDAAWSYAHPTPAFSCIKDHFAFYPSRVHECYVDGERVEAQPGDFYGGWITSEIKGPFKGDPGTDHW
jgi:uncharacterized protein (DUF427 family)